MKNRRDDIRRQDKLIHAASRGTPEAFLERYHKQVAYLSQCPPAYADIQKRRIAVIDAIGEYRFYPMWQEMKERK